MLSGTNDAGIVGAGRYTTGGDDSSCTLRLLVPVPVPFALLGASMVVGVVRGAENGEGRRVVG